MRSLCLIAFVSQVVATPPWARVSFNEISGRYVIVDDQGREIILRGINLEHEDRETADYKRSQNPQDYANACPENNPNYQEPPICEVDFGRLPPNQRSRDWSSKNDISQMKGFGFNVIRLCLSWEDIEPQPGNYSSQYLDRLEQIVSWAAEQDVYVILDFHEDWYSHWLPLPARDYPPYLTFSYGQDGAPAWAVANDGLPSLSIYGQDELNLAMMRSFDHFYANDITDNSRIQGDAPGPGLMDHFIGAVAHVAGRFVNNSAVLGYEILNEPQMGSKLLNPVSFADKWLYPFYRRVIQAITGVRDGLPTCAATVPMNSSCAYPSLLGDTQHIFMFEPSAFRNQLDFSMQTSQPFSEYPHLVFTPHAYTHVFTLDRVFHVAVNKSQYPPSYSFAYETAHAEALIMRSAVLVTEFGVDPNEDGSVLINMTRAQDTSRTGSTLWSWKSNGGGDNGWTVFDSPSNFTTDQNGPAHPSRIFYMARVYPQFVVGSLVAYQYDPESGSFCMQANYTGEETTSRTEIYIPSHVSGAVTFSGAVDQSTVKITTDIDGARTASFSPSGAGIYNAFVGDGASLLEGSLTTTTAFQKRVNEIAEMLKSISGKTTTLDLALAMGGEAILEILENRLKALEKVHHALEGSSVTAVGDDALQPTEISVIDKVIHELKKMNPEDFSSLATRKVSQRRRKIVA